MPSRVRLATTQWRLLVGVGLGAVLIWGAALLSGDAPKPSIADTRLGLMEPLRPMRPLKGRLVGLRYAAFTPQNRILPPAEGATIAFRGDHSQVVPDKSLRYAAQIALTHALSGNLESALAVLELARTQRDEDPQLLSDLAAVCLELGEKDPALYVQALVAADRAAHLDPNLPEAAFNLALILGRLGLKGAAERVWEKFDAIETDPGWRAEASTYREMFQTKTDAEEWRDAWAKGRLAGSDQVRSLVQRYSQFARLEGEETLLPAWAERLTEGDRDGAQRDLAYAKNLGENLAHLGRDGMLLDSVTAVERALSAGHSHDLAYGHMAYARGLALLREGDFEFAASEFTKAAAALQAGSSPFASWAEFQGAFCDYQHANDVRALERLRALGAVVSAERYPVLAGRMEWLTGTILLFRPAPMESLRSYQRALALFERAAEDGNIVAVQTQLANNFRVLGRESEAWTHRASALAAMAHTGDAYRRRVAFSEAGYALLEQSEPAAALYLLTEALEAAKELTASSGAAVAYRYRAIAYQQIGNKSAALHDIQKFREKAERTVDPQIRKVLLGESLLFEARVLGFSQPELARQRLAAALRYQRETRSAFLLPEILAECAELSRRQGDLQAAAEEMRSALTELARQRSAKLPPEYRLSHLIRSRSLYDRAIKFMVEELNRPNVALALDQESRVSHLAGQFTETRSMSLSAVPNFEAGTTITEAQALLEDDASIIVFRLIGDSLLAWVIRRDDIKFRLVPVSRLRLVRTTRRFLASAEGGPKADQIYKKAAGVLFRTLIEPLRDVLPAQGEIFVVPDGPLQDLPFSAFFDEANGRYALEYWRFAFVPGLAVLVESARQSVGEDHRSWTSALGVGASEFNADAFEGLLPIPGVEPEAVLPTGHFPRSLLLLGAEATKERVLDSLSAYEVVHIASHGVNNPKNSLLSALILASGKHSTGELYAHELIAAQTRPPRLFILSACRTARSGEEGASVSLGFACLLGGAPAVIASYWNVEDASAGKFFSIFYNEMKSAESVAAALYEAKLSMARSGDPLIRSPRFWGAFELIGWGRIARSRGENHL